ncbi:MAG TPA: molybdopterin-dependent oxidoreductase [Tepidiformaceae bacterium]|nr:molybdopterin-dependent oxidoreductase [Tepidiformaceae bacterium]
MHANVDTKVWLPDPPPAPGEPTAQDLPPARHYGLRRDGIRPPKFADKFAEIDFEADPMPVISMFTPPAPREIVNVRLAIRGEDLKSRIVSWKDLAGLPVHGPTVDLVCQIFNWHESVTWNGFRLADVLDAFDVQAPADGYLKISSADGQYFETLSIDHARDSRVLLAFGMNGGPLPHEYGGPLRLVVPFLQGYKSVKWVERLDVFKHDPIGIKRLLGQSKTSRLGQAWLDRLAIAPPTGRPSDPG